MEENGSVPILTPKRSAGITPEVNHREHVTHTPPPNVTKAAYSGFETQRRCHQKSKTGVSLTSQIFLKKNDIEFPERPCFLIVNCKLVNESRKKGNM